MKKITPFLWFNDKAEEAAKFYVSIFKNSKVVTVTRYGDAGPGPKGSVMTVAFRLEGQDFVYQTFEAGRDRIETTIKTAIVSSDAASPP